MTQMFNVHTVNWRTVIFESFYNFSKYIIYLYLFNARARLLAGALAAPSKCNQAKKGSYRTKAGIRPYMTALVEIAPPTDAAIHCSLINLS